MEKVKLMLETRVDNQGLTKLDSIFENQPGVVTEDFLDFVLTNVTEPIK